jgi:hypothetical protein
MLKTLKAARESSLSSISGACASSDAFLSLLNEAVERLLNRGDWSGTVVPIMTCVLQGCVVWPRYVGSVRRINVCNTPVSTQNVWTQFLQYESPNWQDSGRWWGSNAWGAYAGAAIPTAGAGQGAFMMDQTRSPVFQDIQGDGRLVRAYPQYQADIGKTIRIFGTDNNGQTLRTKQIDGTWRDGWVITLASPYGSTSDYVRKIDRVILDEMQGDVRVYAYNATTTLLEPIANYEPGDVNPAFERYRLDLRQCGCDCVKSVIALVKLKFIPARYDNDLVLIENLPAVKLMIQSIKASEANNPDLADRFELQAIRELNMDLNNQSPREDIQVSIASFGKRSFIGQRCF